MLRKSLVAGFALVLGTALAALWWRIDGERMPEFDYPEPPPTPEPNAFDFLVQAARAIPDEDAIIDAVTGRWDPETDTVTDLTLEEKQRILAANREALDRLRKGLQHTFLYPDLLRVIDMEGPQRFSDFRMLGRLLRLESEIHRAEGHIERSINAVLDCLELGRMIGPDTGHIGALTGIAISGMAFVQAADLIDFLGSGERLDAIPRLKVLAQRRIDMTDVLLQEKWHALRHFETLFEDERWRLGLAMLYQADDAWDFGPQWTDLEELPFLERQQVRLRSWRFHKQRMVDAYLDWIEMTGHAMQHPFAEGKASWPQPDFRLPPIIADYVTDTIPGTWFLVLCDQTNLEMLRAKLALEEYRHETGAYPERLDDLAGQFFDTLPKDPFTAVDPLRYRREGNSYVLYSIGPNGQDNGGAPMERSDLPPQRRYFPHSDLSGDIVAGINLPRRAR